MPNSSDGVSELEAYAQKGSDDRLSLLTKTFTEPQRLRATVHHSPQTLRSSFQQAKPETVYLFTLSLKNSKVTKMEQ